MRNSYTMPEAFELGRTEEVVLGSKPMVMDQIDAVLGMFYRTEPLPDDIDENDD